MLHCSHPNEIQLLPPIITCPAQKSKSLDHDMTLHHTDMLLI